MNEAESWKRSRGPSAEGRVHKTWHGRSLGSYSVIKRKEVFTRAMTWPSRSVEGARHKRRHLVGLHSREMPGTGKSVETVDSWLPGAGGLGVGTGRARLLARGFPLWDEGVVMVTQPECT